MVTGSPPRAEMPTRRFATGAIVELYKSIIAQEDGAIAGDVEAIHDMRVAIRRLRVALSNFACTLSREDRRRLQSHLKKLAEPLGGVRDFDVMIAALAARIAANPGQDATKSIIGRFRDRRRRRLRKLVDYLHGEEFAVFKQKISAFEAEDSSQLKKHGQAA